MSQHDRMTAKTLPFRAFSTIGTRGGAVSIRAVT